MVSISPFLFRDKLNSTVFFIGNNGVYVDG